LHMTQWMMKNIFLLLQPWQIDIWKRNKSSPVPVVC